jgi:hypothetical protein
VIRAVIHHHHQNSSETRKCLERFPENSSKCLLKQTQMITKRCDAVIFIIGTEKEPPIIMNESICDLRGEVHYTFTTKTYRGSNA